MWGAGFILIASFLYFRPISNMFSALPLFLGAMLVPFFVPHGLGTLITTVFSVIVSLLFGTALGVKNLILIHRAVLLETAAYVLSYITFLLFFMQAGLGVFFPLWIITIFILWLAFCLLIFDYRLALALAGLFGELIWVVSWLPIGFLSSTNICFLIILCAGDAVRKNKISGKNVVIVLALGIVILSMSYWAI